MLHQQRFRVQIRELFRKEADSERAGRDLTGRDGELKNKATEGPQDELELEDSVLDVCCYVT